MTDEIDESVSQEEREDARRAVEYLREHGVQVTWYLEPSPPPDVESLLADYIENHMQGVDDDEVITAIKEDYGLAEE